jgi:hypothetical protein
MNESVRPLARGPPSHPERCGLNCQPAAHAKVVALCLTCWMRRTNRKGKSVTSLLAVRAGVGNAVDWDSKPPAFGCAMDSDPSTPPNNKISTNCFELTNEEKNSLFRLWKTSVIHFSLV